MKVDLMPFGRHARVDRVTLFLGPIFLIFLADATMAYTYPIITERLLLSNTLLGLIMGSSSVAGVICDLIFPGLLRGRGWGTQFLLGATLALLFPLAIHISTFFAPALFAIFGAIIWGIYYEFLQFSQQGMVTEEEAPEKFTRTWGVVYAVLLVTTIIGPILGSLLLSRPIIEHTAVILVIQAAALLTGSIVIWFFKSKSMVDRTCNGPRCKSALADAASVIRCARTWGVFIRTVFPVILMGITVKLIEATYWTLGGLFGEEVGGANLGWLMLTCFEVALLAGALIIARIELKSEKKRLSQEALILGGIVLAGISFTQGHPFLFYAVVTFSSFALSFALPLNDAVYTDLIDRLKVGKLELTGLAKANSSIAYIVAPVLMGILADATNYYTVFSTLGVSATVIGIILLVITPRKLRLPQAELASIK